MLTPYNEALQIYETLPAEIRAPGLHPYYVTADALRDSALSPSFWIYREGTHVYYHAFHVSPIPCLPGWFDIQSPYGYGGPIATTTDPEILARAHSAFFEWCRECNILAEFIRFHPILQNERYFSGDQFIDRTTVAVDLSGEFKIQYSKRVKQKIKKFPLCELSYTQKNETDFLFFCECYQSTMQRIGADASYLFPQRYVQQLCQWKQCEILTASERASTPCAASVFLEDGNLVEYHLSCTTEKGFALDATTFLLDSTALSAQRRGKTWLHLGGGTDNLTDNPLLFFKKGFSNSTFLFKIGRAIHNRQHYQKLKEQFSSAGKSIDKVLFYRF